MIELSYAGKLNVFWFILSLLTALLAIIENIGFWPHTYLPSVFDNLWIYNLVTFISINLILALLYSDFTYATTVRSCLLGHVFAAGIHIAMIARQPWSVIGWYLCVLSAFHFSEFLAIAWCNTSSLSVSSFILNHSVEYWIALTASWIEYVLEVYVFPVTKSYMGISWLGFGLCLFGEAMRKTAMFTAATNFTHLVQQEKEETHQLVTHGIYSWCRHPSYVGWFFWSIGTQMLLMNPVCLVAYTIVSWQFFKGRIMMEEWYLLKFFQEEYQEYQEKVGTGLPFIKGLILKSYKE